MKYDVTVEVSGTLQMEVEAESEEEALKTAYRRASYAERDDFDPWVVYPHIKNSD